MSSECCRPRAAGVAGPGQGGRVMVRAGTKARNMGRAGVLLADCLADSTDSICCSRRLTHKPATVCRLPLMCSHLGFQNGQGCRGPAGGCPASRGCVPLPHSDAGHSRAAGPVAAAFCSPGTRCSPCQGSARCRDGAGKPGHCRTQSCLRGKPAAAAAGVAATTAACCPFSGSHQVRSASTASCPGTGWQAAGALQGGWQKQQQYCGGAPPREGRPGSGASPWAQQGQIRRQRAGGT